MQGEAPAMLQVQNLVIAPPETATRHIPADPMMLQTAQTAAMRRSGFCKVLVAGRGDGA
jgi:hypothetical protein